MQKECELTYVMFYLVQRNASERRPYEVFRYSRIETLFG